MRDFEITSVEQIIGQLDLMDKLFPQFRLSIENNHFILLGRGGFSYVYEMHNVNLNDNKYALKITGFTKCDTSSEAFAESVRLQYLLSEESRYVCRIISSRELYIKVDNRFNVTSVLEKNNGDNDEDIIDLQFVLMEKIEPVITKDRFRNIIPFGDRICNEHEVIKLALEIGNALAVAHTENILHRDIKLENIFWDTKDQIYKLGDFGVSKHTEDGNAETVVYTNGYGAPEIHAKANGRYNVTADIYSFGITLYLLLNDFRFPGSDGYYSKVEIQYNPDYVFPAPINASERLARIIMKMCSFREVDRYQSISEMLFDLASNYEIEDAELFEELMDLSTETYHSDTYHTEKLFRPEQSTPVKENERVYRKKTQKMLKKMAIEDGIKYGFLLTIVGFIAMIFAPVDEYVLHDIYLLFPIMVLFEALLQWVRDFRYMFGLAIVVAIIYSMAQVGFTVMHVVLLVSILFGMPVITMSASIAAGLWLYLTISGAVGELTFFIDYPLGWIVMILYVILMISYRGNVYVNRHYFELQESKK